MTITGWIIVLAVAALVIAMALHFVERGGKL